ncbi:MAG: Nif11-like leader peptide family natural product precursor [Firmicutes bacterium]|nr:Nif11-like leader peptide family natural product precursor [Bacillota bacterium]
MSVADLKAFGKKVVENEELKKKAKQVGMDNIEGIIALAKENGFDVSKADFEAAAKDLKSSDELSEDDLEQVAGGFITVAAAAAVVGAGAGVASTTSSGGW